jgi:hypothetical protein
MGVKGRFFSIMKTLILVSLSLLGISTASLAATPEEINTANATRTQLGGTVRDGITLRGTEAVVTRNGVTTKLEHDLLLRNGMLVHANGNITQRDGSATALRPNQLLTFEGDIEDVLLTPDGVAPLSAVAEGPGPRAAASAATRDGIRVMNGAAFITRDGVTEKVRSDVRLPNGVVAKPDGTVIMNNGNIVVLKPDQVLDLAGVLRDSHVHTVPSGVKAVVPR